MSYFEQIDLKSVKTHSIDERQSKVSIADFGQGYQTGMNCKGFFEDLPNILVVKNLRQLTRDILDAKKKGKKIIWMMGAHVIKCGLNPLIIQMLYNGFISCIAFNGAGCIHDTEIAFFGKTSEDVQKNLESGTFGFARETAEIINHSLNFRSDLGFGEALGKTVFEAGKYKDFSILGAAYELCVPVTVHAAIGTDIIHQHPGFDAAKAGEMSHRDFRIFCKQVSELEGGVILNFGSAVILPEVFLKALSVCRNLDHKVKHFTAANFDMIQQYRARENILKRTGANAYQFTGHHEIMIPLLVANILENE